MTHPNTRRHFLQTATATATAVSLTGTASAKTATTGATLKNQLFKTLKIGMVGEGSTLTEKFKAAKAAGFAAI
ncbi:MAG: twin-arginine translocation signal domain-containing protein, partial [Planctomycetaceae bacterium]|nr:twin-arginine translocation signal domain-containing protein [Planctomycetaceae bacterium]